MIGLEMDASVSLCTTQGDMTNAPSKSSSLDVAMSEPAPPREWPTATAGAAGKRVPYSSDPNSFAESRTACRILVMSSP